MADTAGGPRPGEFRAGNNLIIAAAEVTLTPLRPKLFYLMEAYAPTEQAAKMGVAIRDSAGKPVVETPPLEVTVAPGGSMLKGQLDLTGLPPGDYTMTSRLELGGETIERSALLTMAGLTETLVRDSAARDSRVGRSRSSSVSGSSAAAAHRCGASTYGLSGSSTVDSTGCAKIASGWWTR